MTISSPLRLAAVAVFSGLLLTGCATSENSSTEAAPALNPFSCSLDIAEAAAGEAPDVGRMICGDDSVEVVAEGKGLTGSIGDAGWNVTETTLASDHNGDFHVVYFNGPYNDQREIDCTAVSSITDTDPVTDISCGTVPTESAMESNQEATEAPADDHEGHDHAEGEGHEDEMVPMDEPAVSEEDAPPMEG